VKTVFRHKTSNSLKYRWFSRLKAREQSSHIRDSTTHFIFVVLIELGGKEQGSLSTIASTDSGIMLIQRSCTFSERFRSFCVSTHTYPFFIIRPPLAAIGGRNPSNLNLPLAGNTLDTPRLSMVWAPR